MLELNNITLRIGNELLLNSASLSLYQGNRVGLIGRNGAGKSTLLNLILGKIQEDQGTIHCSVKENKIAHLEQALPHSDTTALEFVKTGDKEWLEINKKMSQLTYQNDGIQLAHLHSDLEDIDGYTLEARASQILHGLGFATEQFNHKVNSFSGGWQMRLQLAKVLISRPDLLLLDEPTNHLDLESIFWLEQMLAKKKCCTIIISHDRDFLDNVCNQIVHLHNRKLKLYTGNYSQFIQQFNLQNELEQRENIKLDLKRKHLQSFVDRFRYKASKAKQAQSRLKALEKLQPLPDAVFDSHFNIEFFNCQKLSNPFVTLKGDIGYPNKKVINNVNISLNYNDRIALLGKNGEGKSTLLKTLAKTLKLYSGKLDIHKNTIVGYYSQQQLDSLDYDSTPIEHILQQDSTMTEGQARNYLGKFGFQNERVFDKIKVFSGGEKARLALALLILLKPNLLLLDEPTNHLDIPMREELILALQQYQGALVLVSHDRHFLNSIVDEFWLISNNSLRHYTENLDNYYKYITQTEIQSSHDQQQKKSITSHNEPTNQAQQQNINETIPTNNTNRKLSNQLEREINKLHSQYHKIEQQLQDDTLYQAENKKKLDSLLERLAKLKKNIEEKENQWYNINDQNSNDCNNTD